MTAKNIDGTEVTFTIPGDPYTKSRARHARLGNGRVVTYTDKKTSEGMRLVASAYRAVRGAGEPSTGGFTVTLVFHVERRQRRDIDNYAKLVMDGLTGLAWVDDSQVTELHAKVIHQSAEPKTVVHLMPNGDLPDYTGRKCEECSRDFRVRDSWSSRRFCANDCRLASIRRKRAAAKKEDR